MSTIDAGELLYTVTLNITGMKEYGVSFAALMAGEVQTPVEGARFDVAFEGTATGPKLNGAAEGIDYVRVLADGRFRRHSTFMRRLRRRMGKIFLLTATEWPLFGQRAASQMPA